MANTGGDKRPTLVLGELVFVGGVQGSVLFGEVVSYPDEYKGPRRRLLRTASDKHD